jgi:pilus assembly protein Flp/PilA
VKVALSNFVGDEIGATAVEYGLIAGFVALAIVSAVVSMGDSVSSIYLSLSADLEAVTTAGGPEAPGGPGGPGGAGGSGGPGGPREGGRQQ